MSDSKRSSRRPALLSTIAATAAVSLLVPSLVSPAPATRDPEWARGAVLYVISVRSFADGNGDGVGDLAGLTAKLDALNDGDARTLNDLGVDALWLAPIVRPGGGGIDPAYGTDADFDRLVSAAHRRGMKVVVELPAKDPRWLARGVDGFAPGDDGLPLHLDPALGQAIVQGVSAGEAGGIAGRLADLASSGHGPSDAIDAPLFAGRDTGSPGSLAPRLGGDPARQKLAAAILVTLPGAPAIAAGDELGLGEGARPGDDAARAAEATDPSSILSCYRFLIRARHNSPALRKGDLEVLSPTTGKSPVLAYLRTRGSERVLAVHNLGGSAVDAGPFAVAGAPDPLFVSPGVPPPHAAGGSFTVHLPPRASGVWRLR